MSIDSFLEDLSRAGATHHSAIIYGSTVREMEFFASILGLPTVAVI
jgi:L-arabinose isomerase